MQKPPAAQNMVDRNFNTTSEWLTWFTVLWSTAGALDDSGTTAKRPTVKLYQGWPYFDTTLGKPIWLKSTRPTVWVDATGSPC